MSGASSLAMRPTLRTGAPSAPRSFDQQGSAYLRPSARRIKAAGDPTPLACTVAKNALEAALGGEGLAQLARWLSPDVHASLVKQHAIARRGRYQLCGTVGIVRIRLQRTDAGVVEAAVVAKEGMRGRAVAMRLEDRYGRWLITALEIG